MAITAVAQDSKLKLSFDGGLDGDGKAIVKSKTFSKIKAAAVNDDVYALATSLTGLQEKPLLSVRRIDEVDLTEII